MPLIYDHSNKAGTEDWKYLPNSGHLPAETLEAMSWENYDTGSRRTPIVFTISSMLLAILVGLTALEMVHSVLIGIAAFLVVGVVLGHRTVRWLVRGEAYRRVKPILSSPDAVEICRRNGSYRCTDLEPLNDLFKSTIAGKQFQVSLMSKAIGEKKLSAKDYLAWVNDPYNGLFPALKGEFDAYLSDIRKLSNTIRCGTSTDQEKQVARKQIKVRNDEFTELIVEQTTSA